MLFAHEFFDALPLKYVGHYTAVVGSIFTSALDPAAKINLKHSDDGTTSHTPSAMHSPPRDRPSPTSQTRFRAVLAREPSAVSTLLGGSIAAFFIYSRRRAHRGSCNLIPNCTQVRNASLLSAGGSALVVDYRTNTPWHAAGTLCEYVFSHDKLLLFLRRANTILGKDI
jgi:hypothetical protein